MPSVLRCGDRELVLGTRTFVMGVVNVTPDSFSDGGRYLSADAAIAQGLRLLDEGADLLDLGGESTRPGAEPVPVDEELARVLPVVQGLVARGARCLSIDTRRAVVAKACLEAGASWINDVSALQDDPALAPVAAQADALVLMHRREMTLLASRNAHPKDFTRIVKLIEDGKINTQPWITHRAAFDEMIETFPSWLKPESGVIKAVVALT